MAFDWSQYLALAKKLETWKDDEAALRTAVSRAYYAAYCRAKKRLDEDKVEVRPSPDGGIHKCVWDAYRGAKDRFRKNIGTTGDRLMQQRVNADYKDKTLVWSKEVEAAISGCEYLLGFLDQLREPYQAG